MEICLGHAFYSSKTGNGKNEAAIVIKRIFLEDQIEK